MEYQADDQPDAKERPELRLRRLWLSRLDREEKEHKAYREQAKKAREHYRQQKKGSDSESVKYPIFWSSVNALHASVFAQMPSADIRRRWADGSGVDDMAKTLERAISYSLDTEDYASHGHLAVNDYLVEALGIAKVEMRTVTTEEPVVNPITGEPIIGEDDEPLTQTVIAKQALQIRHFPTCRFRWEPAPSWEVVDWIAFEHPMTAGEIKKQFDIDIKAQIKSDDKKVEYPVFEIWDKKRRRRIYLCQHHDELLAVEDDPLGLEGFYPCPAPMLANPSSEELTPKPDYCFIKYQLDELDRLTGRITVLADEIKDVGLYDASMGEEIANLKAASDGTLIPVAGLLDRLDTSGSGATFGRVIAKPDNGTTVQTLQNLIQIREGIRQEVERYFGVSDVQLGQTDPGETAKAQQLKAQWSNIRTSPKMAEISQFFRDLYRIMAEIIAEHFDPAQLTLMTGVEVTPESQQIMRDDMRRSYSIDIETDSTRSRDDSEDRAQTVEMVNSMTAFIGQTAPMVQQGFMSADLAKALTMMTVQGFKRGGEIEDAIEAMPSTMQQLQQMQQQIQQLTQQLQQAQQQGQQMQGQLQQVNERKEQREDIKTQADVMDKQASAYGKQAEAVKDMATARDINYPGPQINSIPQ